MTLDPARGYDLIGDVHGCARTLERLLEQLGYRREGGCWRHPRRMALFLGDIVDRGPRIREALHLVRDMVDAGEALCMMGNHEYDALGWQVPAASDSIRRFVRDHTDRNRRIIGETFDQFAGHPQDWRDFLGWFYTLPVVLDAGFLRMVHACWDTRLVDELLKRFPDARIDEAYVAEAGIDESLPCRTLDRLLRGTGMRLPAGRTLTSRDGFTRSMFRTKFWEPEPQTMGDIVFQPDALPEDVAGMALSPEQKGSLLCYGEDEPLLFVGHYWCSGAPAPIRPNLACLDYSAVLGGKLVAYRFNGERRLEPANFAWVSVESTEVPYVCS